MKNKSMMLVTSSWNQMKTFKMLPVTLDCPFNECIYDIQTKMLAIIGKSSKESLHMLPKLTDQGDVQFLKLGKRGNGKDYAEERKILDTFYEYYIEDAKEIEEFISMFAVNDKFDIKPFVELVVDTTPKVPESNLITSI
jgi:hypothetical protein